MINSIYDFSMNDIDGNSISFHQYKGKVLLIVNVASRCGFTYQYEGLQKVYEKYKGQGFLVLGFPANNFLWQEPGNNQQIKNFCTTKYNVSFPIFEKISVAGSKMAPLYKFLTEKDTNPEFHGKIAWNFTKFLIDQNGKICGRFEPKTEPESEIFIKQLENILE